MESTLPSVIIWFHGIPWHVIAGVPSPYNPHLWGNFLIMADVGTPTDDILRSSGDDGDHSLGAEEIIKSLDEDVIDMAKNDVVKHIFGEAALNFVGQTVEAAVGMIPFGKEIMKLGVGIFKRCSAVGELATQVKSAQELVKSLVKDVAECATSIKTEEDSLPLVECLKELYVLTMQISKLGKVAKTVTVNTFLEKLKIISILL